MFHEVSAVDPEQRAALLLRLCDDDVALRTEVSSLVDASMREALQGRRRVDEARRAAEVGSGGRRVGPYILDRVLGRGGMGAVYLAHRADGQFEQQVAIKLIDLPLATELFRERFRFERQILAGLVHPYIARLLDGGVSDADELYLAMEYVAGAAITSHCDEAKLNLRERLELFAKVCSAVQFAHQNLVVHRDLKPANIFVVSDGTPRLLDFGTAKLLVPIAADAAAGFTQHGLQSFTPQYASPEQVLGGAITTATDTYSLGVLLFVLLTGSPPYEIKEFTTAEMLRVICSEAPQKPSAVPRHTGARGNHPWHIDADLDAIVLKALRKEPERRYVTVDQLMGDIQAWLAGRPVLARRGNWRYRAGKFIRRNTLPLAVAVLLLFSVIGGIAGVLWQSHQAVQQRRRAEARSDDLRQLSNSLLSEIDEAIKELPGSTSVQRLLVERVLDHLDRMSRDAGNDRTADLDLINAYTRLGNLQGNPYDQNIGDPAGALVSLGKALTLAVRLQAAGAPDTEALAALALAQQSRSEVLFGVGRTEEAIVSMRAALQAFEARVASPGAPPAAYADAATAAGSLGDQLGQAGVASLGDRAGALTAYRQSLAFSSMALRLDPHFARSQRSIAVSHIKVANIIAATDPMAAMEEYRQSIRAWQAMPAVDQPAASTRRGIAMAQLKIAYALSETGDYARSLAEFDQASDSYEYYAAADKSDTRAQYDLAVFLSGKALVYMDMLNPDLNAQGKERASNTQTAITLLRRSIGIRSRLVAIDPTNRGWVANEAYEKTLLGTLEQETAEANEGAKLAAAGSAKLVELASLPDAAIDVLDYATTAMLGVKPLRLRNPAWTAHTAERLVTMTHRQNPAFLLTLAQALGRARRFEEAMNTAREGLQLWGAHTGDDGPTRLQKLLILETNVGHDR